MSCSTLGCVMLEFFGTISGGWEDWMRIMKSCKLKFRLQHNIFTLCRQNIALFWIYYQYTVTTSLLPSPMGKSIVVWMYWVIGVNLGILKLSSEELLNIFIKLPIYYIYSAFIEN